MKKLVAAILALLTALSLAMPVLAQPDKPVEVVVVVVIVVVCDDAWGNHLYVTDSHIARVNPITYRGYYFDWETGLFYLQSRYYCPNLRRFISADVYLDTNQGVLGTNMYAYCLNNPVNRIDPDGFRSQAITYEQHRREVQAGGSFILGVLTLYLLTQAPTAPAPPRPRVQTQTQTQTGTTNPSLPPSGGNFFTDMGIPAATAVALIAQSIGFVQSVEESVARAQRPLNPTIHRHHIVAHSAARAAPARNILNQVGINVNSDHNLVPLPAWLHNRIHTDTYYFFVNAVVAAAFAVPGDSRQNVISALGFIRGLLLAMTAIGGA